MAPVKREMYYLRLNTKPNIWMNWLCWSENVCRWGLWNLFQLKEFQKKFDLSATLTQTQCMNSSIHLMFYWSLNVPVLLSVDSQWGGGCEQRARLERVGQIRIITSHGDARAAPVQRPRALCCTLTALHGEVGTVSPARHTNPPQNAQRKKHAHYSHHGVKTRVLCFKLFLPSLEGCNGSSHA